MFLNTGYWNSTVPYQLKLSSLDRPDQNRLEVVRQASGRVPWATGQPDKAKLCDTCAYINSGQGIIGCSKTVVPPNSTTNSSLQNYDLFYLIENGIVEGGEISKCL